MTETPKNTPEERIAEQFTGECLEEHHWIGAHGTLGKEIAEKIMAEGIVVNPAYGIHEMAVGLPENPMEAAEEICHWRHKNAKFIVIISVPESLREKQYLEEIQWDNGQWRTRLPARFIKGYFDVEQAQFIKNLQYESNAAPTATIGEIIERQSHIHKKIMRGISKEPMPPPIPGEHASENVEDIW